MRHACLSLVAFTFSVALSVNYVHAQGAAVAVEAAEPVLPKATIDGVGPDWKELGETDFAHVNDEPDTWKFEDGLIKGTGKPVGVLRTVKKLTNFELVGQWKHLTSGGNSGFFVWTSDEALQDIKPGQLPKGGIEVQVLDHGYATKYQEKNPGKTMFFSTNGDVFPVGTSKMTPFPPLSPNGARSFPRKNLAKGHGEWNHYYVRAINGEVRLWVNGEEVSGGTGCTPATGYLCLEAEGAPIEFKNIRIRELP